MCNSTQFASHDVEKIFGRRNVMFRILTDLSCIALENPQYRAVLRDLGFDVPERVEASDNVNYESYLRIRSQIARLLFTPTPEIVYLAEQNLQAWKQQREEQHLVGIQLRTGGYVASTHESERFLFISSLSLLYEEVEHLMKKNGWSAEDTTLFVSSDSGIMMGNVLQHYQNQMRVVKTIGYRQGHSSPYKNGGKHLVFLKRAILDLLLLSNSDYVLYTHKSSYGKLAMRLSQKPARALCRQDHCTPLEG